MKEKLVYKNGFVLYGNIESKTDAGVWFKTNQQTSFISYDLIESISKLNGDY